PALRSQSEIDEQVAAKDDAQSLEEHHLAVVTEIHPVKPDQRLQRIRRLKTLIVDRLKVLFAQLDACGSGSPSAQGILRARILARARKVTSVAEGRSRARKCFVNLRLTNQELARCRCHYCDASEEEKA